MSFLLHLLLLFFTLATANVDTGFDDDTGWHLRSTTSTTPQATTYSKPFPGSHLTAFRGVTVLDAHISAAMGLFCDFRLAAQWVDMLESIRALDAPNATDYMDCRPDGAVDTVHQVSKLPWPLSKREVVLQRRWSYENSPGKTVTVRYRSVLDPRAPLPLPGANTVRAESPHTLWRFQALHPSPGYDTGDSSSNGTCAAAQTRVEVQVIVSAGGSVPAWLVNQVQRRWPLTALAAFDRLVQAGKKNEAARQAGAKQEHQLAASPFLPVAHW